MNTQPQENNEQAADSRHPVVKWPEKNKSVLVGFFGWYVLNGLFWLSQGNPSMTSLWRAQIANVFIFPLNLLTLLILAAIKSTRKIALGILIALAVNLFLSLLVGAFLNGVCFVPFYLK
jgi:hypothetical protein